MLAVLLIAKRGGDGRRFDIFAEAFKMCSFDSWDFLTLCILGWYVVTKVTLSVKVGVVLGVRREALVFEATLSKIGWMKEAEYPLLIR